MSHKYIRTKKYGFVIWPRNDDIWHSHIAHVVGGRDQLVSAGFANFVNGVANCYGMSESLKLASDPSDSRALTLQLQVKS